MLGNPLRMVAEFFPQQIWFLFYYIMKQVGLLFKYIGNVVT